MSLNLYEVAHNDIYIAEDLEQVIRMHKEMYPDTLGRDEYIEKIPPGRVIRYSITSIIGGEGVIVLTARQWTQLISKPQHLMQYEW